MILNYFKKRAIKKYYKLLPSVLAKDYVRSDFYSAGQVKAVIKKKMLWGAYKEYAVAMFISFEKTETIFKSEYPNLNGYQIRAQVADVLFDGDMHYIATKSLGISKHGNGGVDPLPGGTQSDN